MREKRHAGRPRANLSNGDNRTASKGRKRLEQSFGFLVRDEDRARLVVAENFFDFSQPL